MTDLVSQPAAAVSDAEIKRVCGQHGISPRSYVLAFARAILARGAQEVPEHCRCNACKDGVMHASDCAVHNGPALPVGSCDCRPGRAGRAGMSQEIRFFVKATKEDAPRGFDYFIRDDGTVWRDNYQTCESQCAVVGFEDFIMPCPEIGWEFAVHQPDKEQ